jgi:hypothetical protein
MVTPRVWSQTAKGKKIWAGSSLVEISVDQFTRPDDQHAKTTLAHRHITKSWTSAKDAVRADRPRSVAVDEVRPEVGLPPDNGGSLRGPYQGVGHVASPFPISGLTPGVKSSWGRSALVTMTAG